MEAVPVWHLHHMNQGYEYCVPFAGMRKTLCVRLWTGDLIPSHRYKDISMALLGPCRVEGSDPNLPRNKNLWFTKRASVSIDALILYLETWLGVDNLWWLNQCGARNIVLALASSPTPDKIVGDEYRACLLVSPTSLTESWQLKNDDDASEFCYRTGHFYGLHTVQRIDCNPEGNLRWKKVREYYEEDVAYNVKGSMPKPEHGYVRHTWCGQFHAIKYILYELECDSTPAVEFDARIGTWQPADSHRELTDADMTNKEHNRFTRLEHRTSAWFAASVARTGLGAVVDTRTTSGGRPCMVWTQGHGEDYIKEKKYQWGKNRTRCTLLSRPLCRWLRAPQDSPLCRGRWCNRYWPK
jgi:hypothetical protein